jgi:hypothetical protein
MYERGLRRASPCWWRAGRGHESLVFKAGALVLADRSVCCFDELDNTVSTHRGDGAAGGRCVACHISAAGGTLPQFPGFSLSRLVVRALFDSIT